MPQLEPCETLDTDLDSEIAIVTGAGRGNGRATAKSLAEHGAHVIVTDLDSARADRVAEDIADAMTFLVSPAADYINGHELRGRRRPGSQRQLAAGSKSRTDLGESHVRWTPMRYAGFRLHRRSKNVEVTNTTVHPSTSRNRFRISSGVIPYMSRGERLASPRMQ